VILHALPATVEWPGSDSAPRSDADRAEIVITFEDGTEDRE
jgi:hypothetical protein